MARSLPYCYAYALYQAQLIDVNWWCMSQWAKGLWRRKIVVGFSIFSLIFTGFLMDSLNSKPCSYFSRNVQLLSLIFHSKLFSCSFQFIIKLSLIFFFMFHHFRYHFAKKESHNSSCSSSTQFSCLSVVHWCLMI